MVVDMGHELPATGRPLGFAFEEKRLMCTDMRTVILVNAIVKADSSEDKSLMSLNQECKSEMLQFSFHDLFSIFHHVINTARDSLVLVSPKSGSSTTGCLDRYHGPRKAPPP
jgi:hypothetical protein